MDKAFVKTMQTQLLAMKEEILENLASENKDFEQLVQDMDPKDLVDLAADDIDRKTLETLSQQDVKRLNLIDSALSRVRNGRYGVCMKCSKVIGKERLQAIPYALMCIDCQSKDERKNR